MPARDLSAKLKGELVKEIIFIHSCYLATNSHKMFVLIKMFFVKTFILKQARLLAKYLGRP